MNLTGLPALDVAIGLSFMFLLLSLLASAVQEMLASLFALRAKTLEQGLRNMLADPDAPAPPEGNTRDLVFAIYTHPLIRSLYRDTRLPSYIAPRSFALALIDTIAPDVALTADDGTPKADHDIIRETREAIVGLGLPAAVSGRLLGLLDDARGDLDAFRFNIEAWFDDTMARVSGWYKRMTQVIIALVAIVVTIALNANALTMGERLWRDPTLRSAVAQQAGTATGTTEGATARDRVNNAVANVEDVTKLGVPIGWAQSNPDDPRHVALSSVSGIARGVGGWLLTVLALSLGAPFWFDTLSRLSRLRGSGKPETPLPASGRGQPGERVVATSPAGPRSGP